jgi:hypothetical protein
MVRRRRRDWIEGGLGEKKVHAKEVSLGREISKGGGVVRFWGARKEIFLINLY